MTNDDLSEKISNVQNFISEQNFNIMEMLVLIGFIQSQVYEELQKAINLAKDV